MTTAFREEGFHLPNDGADEVGKLIDGHGHLVEGVVALFVDALEPYGNSLFVQQENLSCFRSCPATDGLEPDFLLEKSDLLMSAVEF